VLCVSGLTGLAELNLSRSRVEDAHVNLLAGLSSSLTSLDISHCRGAPPVVSLDDILLVRADRQGALALCGTHMGGHQVFVAIYGRSPS
jgi:hypothetical protein